MPKIGGGVEYFWGGEHFVRGVYNYFLGEGNQFLVRTNIVLIKPRNYFPIFTFYNKQINKQNQILCCSIIFQERNLHNA